MQLQSNETVERVMQLALQLLPHAQVATHPAPAAQAVVRPLLPTQPSLLCAGRDDVCRWPQPLVPQVGLHAADSPGSQAAAAAAAASAGVGQGGCHAAINLAPVEKLAGSCLLDLFVWAR